MLGKTYDRENCSAARALELVGERWSLLIVRDALFRGRTRFADFQRSLGVATNVLATRLDAFVAAGLMERRTYSSHEDHYQYLLTDKGRDLAPVVIALTEWGDRWAAPNGPPIEYRHQGCGGAVTSTLTCARCGQQVPAGAIEATPGPGSRDTPDPKRSERQHRTPSPDAATAANS
jgi:DNA-binding HxlR family transcriptional regulator